MCSVATCTLDVLIRAFPCAESECDENLSTGGKRLEGPFEEKGRVGKKRRERRGWCEGSGEL